MLLLLVGPAIPAMAQGVGAIGGTVTDASGGVLPGVNVTLTNQAGAIGGNQTALTTEQGTYQFLRLVPGSYTVKAELQGFRPTEQRNIIVDADVTARADFKLEIGTLAEGVTVSGEAPLLDTTTALRQTVLSRDVLEAMPNRSDVWAIAKVLPGVTLSKVDVGGSEGFLQSSATMHGTSGENKFTIDGLDVSSLDGSATIATMYLDPYAFQETNFMMGAGSAENSNGGLTFNMVTRTGTNQVHGGVTYNVGPTGWVNTNNLTPSQITQLLSAVPAKVKAANPNLSPNANVTQWYDFGAFVAGPAVKDKLWYSLTWHQQRFNDYKLGNYNVDGTPIIDDNWMWTSSEKVAWQVTKSAQLSYFNNLQYKFIGHRGGGMFGDGAARQFNFKYPDVHQVKFTTTIGTKMVVDSSYNRFRADDCFCKRAEVALGAIADVDSTISSQTVALATYNANKMFRDQVRVAASYFAGAHDIRFGYEGMKGGEKSRVWSVSGMRANFANGVPVSVNTYALPVTTSSASSGPDVPNAFENWSIDNGVYVQDRWSVTRRFVVNAGVRYETNSSYEPATCRDLSAMASFVVSVLPASASTCYSKVNAPSFKNASPRINTVWDVRGDGRTAVKFAANRYDQPINISMIARLNPVSTTSDTRAWTKCAVGQTSGCDLNGDGIPQLNELGPSSGFVFADANARYAGNANGTGTLKRPVSNEYSAEIQQQLPLNMVLSIGYTHRETRHNVGQENTAILPSQWIGPQTVVSSTAVNAGTPASQATVVVYGRPSTASANLYFNSPLSDTTYNGEDITLNKRMSSHFSVTGGATYGKTTQASAGGDLNNPNIINNPFFLGGITSGDRPWSYRLSGVVQLPYAFELSGTQVVQAGATEQTTAQILAADGATLGPGVSSLSVNTNHIGAIRYPVLTQLDMSLRRNFRYHGRSFSPRLDFYNAGNAATITTWGTLLGPTYHVPTGVQRGRAVKLSVSAEF
jgi:hypothetical protein